MTKRRFNIEEFITSKQCVLLIMAVGCLVRLLFLDKYPGGIAQDGAFGAYESYSLMNYGIDSAGYVHPVYFVSWGSGMSVLYSYLCMPFIRLLGLNLWALRLPQALAACASLYVMYRLVLKIAGQKLAVLVLFLFAINPWHIVLCRWGLDSGITPAFLLFGLYFFVLGMEKEKYLLLSALFYGLALYTYALIWVMLPVMLAFQCIYALWYKKIKLSVVSVLSVLLLGLLALPLILFIMVNFGMIEEITTSFFSIPRLPYFRESEMTSGGYLSNIMNFLHIFIKQDDGLIWNSIPAYGTYYYFSIPFIFIGIGSLCISAVKNWKEKQSDPMIFFLVQFIVVGIFSIFLSQNEINKINVLHIPVIVFSGIGLYKCRNLAWKPFFYLVIALYVIVFATLPYTYTHSYNDQVAYEFQQGAVEAIERAIELTDGQICVTDEIYYPKILYASKLPAPDYVETVVYTNYPHKWLEVASFDRYIREETLPEDGPDEQTVYVWQKEDADFFAEQGYQIEEFDYYITAYK